MYLCPKCSKAPQDYLMQLFQLNYDNVKFVCGKCGKEIFIAKEKRSK